MSAQQIENINKCTVTENIDNFLICEGRKFANNIDYDLDDKVDYKKIELLIALENIKNCDNDDILLIINKILKQ